MYPMESEEAGPHFWHTMGNVIAKYPVRPSTHDKLMFKHWLQYTIDHYVCYDPCIKNARKYIRRNPPDVSSRENLSHWLCLFHNHVRESQGKNQVSCDNVLGQTLSSDEEVNNGKSEQGDQHDEPNTKDNPRVQEDAHSCDGESCADHGREEDVKPDSSTDTNSTNQVFLHDVSSAFKKLKNAGTSVFKALCREFKVPYPDFLYRPCPDMPETSCTSFPVDINGRATGKATIYFNQYVYSPETIPHEFWHYYHKIKGEDNEAADELEVTRKAKEIVKKYFPDDEKEIKLGQSKIFYPEVKKTRYETRYAEQIGTYNSRFPRYSSVIAKEVQPEAEDLHPAGENNPSREGFLRHFDGIYGHLEKGFGIPKEWLNYSYSPEIIATVTQTIVESNLSPVGSLIISGLLGLGLGGYVVAAKQSISQGDRLLLTEMSAHFTTNTIRYANKDAMAHVTSDIERLGAALVRLDFGEMANIMVGRSMFGGYDELPLGYEHVPLPPQQQQPLLRAPPRPVVEHSPLTPDSGPPVTYDDLLLAYGYAAAPSRAAPKSAPSRAAAARAGPRGGARVAPKAKGGRPSTTGIPLPVIQKTNKPTPVPVKGRPMVRGGPPAAARGGPERAVGNIRAAPVARAPPMARAAPPLPRGPRRGISGHALPTIRRAVAPAPPTTTRVVPGRLPPGRFVQPGRFGQLPPQPTREQIRRFRRTGARIASEQTPLFGFTQPDIQAPAPDDTMGVDQTGVTEEPRRRRLISGIDEEGFYHGSEAEVEANEGVASDYWGNSGRNSINLGEEGYYE
jgi:hypothetical protein